jgi:hypothetical protein
VLVIICLLAGCGALPSRLPHSLADALRFLEDEAQPDCR